MGDYLSREDKLAIVAGSRLEDMDWEDLTPNETGDRVNQRDPRYATWQSLGGRGVAAGVFRMGSNRLKTNRDA
ncbi:hypothetical protein [Actinomyces trachealis]|uniref:hypothetical protein n=1 Tax=Actinomyces trachealis TaxID=2763540 RepID=UPI001892C9AD|nr:hypothetical protein [Actinomyces trachealis]